LNAYTNINLVEFPNKARSIFGETYRVKSDKVPAALINTTSVDTTKIMAMSTRYGSPIGWLNQTGYLPDTSWVATVSFEIAKHGLSAAPDIYHSTKVSLSASLDKIDGAHLTAVLQNTATANPFPPFLILEALTLLLILILGKCMAQKRFSIHVPQKSCVDRTVEKLVGPTRVRMGRVPYIQV
jgi:hypothetical protein